MKVESKDIRRWLRSLHRDIGYLLVGITVIYAVSGILLNHRDGNPSYKNIESSVQFQPGLTADGIQKHWQQNVDLPKLNKVTSSEDNTYKLMLDGGSGIYNSQTGTVDYSIGKRKPVAYFINQFHYNKIGGWTLSADIFAGGLIFLAISGLFMVRGKNSLGGRGKWFLLAGIIIPLIFYFI